MRLRFLGWLCAVAAAAAQTPTNNPVASYRLPWTDAIQWSNVMVMEPATVALSAARLGLPADQPWLVADAETGAVLGRGMNTVSVSVPAMDCRRLIWRRAEDHPQWIGTDRHLTGGAVDMRLVQWDAGTGTLSVKVELVAGHPCRIWVAVPAGWRLEDPALECGPGVAGCVLHNLTSGVVPWQMRFTRR